VVTPEIRAEVRRQFLLAGQVLSNLLSDASDHAYSRIAQGKSNADFWYEYVYKVRMTASQDQLVMEFVFDHPEGYPTPTPVRLTIDQSGQVQTAPLAMEEAEELRVEAAATCLEPVVTRTGTRQPVHRLGGE
jgi:hypothetical protein